MSYYNIFNLIGDTPVMELKRYSSGKKIRIFAKLEGTNPGGSIKDRIALYMIRRAQKNKL
ncbi:pyridoxal-phosphate dependent enzyme, partial [Candidatus Gottesmanbacteria bacterium]|nr:pyridoxal-phosphate dependent enzyme [Candidatus Gottesmanbacteria bacterium]